MVLKAPLGTSEFLGLPCFLSLPGCPCSCEFFKKVTFPRIYRASVGIKHIFCLDCVP